MTTLVLENLAALPALAQSARMLLSSLGRWIDGSVSAIAARKVPDCQMWEVQVEIDRHCRPTHR